jgi:predicted RNase H-like HicB family nuclease
MKSEMDRYLAMNYSIELVQDVEQGGFFASHPDLPGCAAQGEMAEEAIANLNDARRLWIESRLEVNLPIPLPLSEEPSGKVLLRMARSLHAELTKHATRQGVSLNLLINTVLAEYVGSAGYRGELPAFQQAVETLKNVVVRAAASQHAETGWGTQPDELHVRETSIASGLGPKKRK